MWTPGPWRFVVIVLMTGPLSGWSYGQSPGPYFPDSIFNPVDKEDNTMIDEHFSIHLSGMMENSLWLLSKRLNKKTIYRILWLPFNDNPICISVTNNGGMVTLRAVQHDGGAGFKTGKIIVDNKRQLTQGQWKKLSDHIQRAGFWGSPIEIGLDQGTTDRDIILFEGVKEGKYHVIDRPGRRADEAVKALCRYMLYLSESRMIHEWDRFRQVDTKTSSKKK